MPMTVQANDGAALPLNSLLRTFAYSGAFLASITMDYQGAEYVQTWTNDGTNIIHVSGWNNSIIPPHGDIMVTEADVIMVTEGGQIMVTE